MQSFKKICGITNYDDALAAAELGADALGFIFYNKSARYIAPEKAAQIINQLPENLLTVGVFVNHSRTDINRIVRTSGISVIQLHGNEQPVDCNYNSVKVWKAIRPVNGNDLETLQSFNVDAFVFDTYDKNYYGGTGKTGNWKLAHQAAQNHKIILSGGLTPDNITGAIETVQPAGIDVNSGVESEPGKKDKRKLKKLFGILQEIQRNDF